jgi:hypothetical protein
VRARLAALAGRHGEQLRQAQWNGHQWRAARASVDLVDLDVAGAVCLASRRLAAEGQEPLTVDEFAGLSDLAFVSVVVGLEMAG